jgi:hypothetical protein
VDILNLIYAYLILSIPALLVALFFKNEWKRGMIMFSLTMKNHLKNTRL